MTKNKKARVMSGEDFQRWRSHRGLTKTAVAELLGVSYQAVQHMEKTGLNSVQALAITAIEHGLQPRTPDSEPQR